MEEDEKESELNASERGEDAGERLPGHRFVDWDDETERRFADQDHDGDIVDADIDASDSPPDPGFMAFASEMEDPLADWPSPESRLEDLPELQRPYDTADDPKPDPEPDPFLFTHDDSEPSAGPEVIDRDQWVPEDTASDGDELENENHGFTTDREAGAGAIVPEFSLPDRPAMSRPAAASDEEELIEDFLRDLDPPEAPLDPLAKRHDNPANDSKVGGPFGSAPMGAILGTSNREVFGADDPARDGFLSDSTQNQDAAPSSAPASPNAIESGSQKQPRGRSIGLAIAILFGFALLAAGGYWVVQQRSELQAEIRDLQARLATSNRAESPQMERVSAQAIEAENDALRGELAGLEIEKSELTARVGDLEADVLAFQSSAVIGMSQAPSADDSAPISAAVPVEGGAEKPSNSTSVDAREPIATPDNAWFVNFGSFSERGVAQRWAEEIRVNSGEVTVQTTTAAGRTLYRVRVVGLASQDDAERIANTLEQQFQLQRLWVGKSS